VTTSTPSGPDPRGPLLHWYRTPLPADVFRRLHERSNARGFVQAAGFLAITASTATLTFWSWRHWPWPYTVLCLLAHGTVSHFYVNGMHELGHGTVFRTRALNAFFLRVYSFLGWHHPEIFNASHQRHHRYTLHPPDDQEVVLPMKLSVAAFLEHAVAHPRWFWWTLRNAWRISRGRFETPWELVCFPPDQPELRVVPVRWARLLLGGHVLVAVVAIALGYWIIPVILSCGPFIGGWLFYLCNNTQHAGRLDNVADFRLCCRTMLPNPVVRFLYWQMNYHIEHHMYAAVPCYHLKGLHAAIRHDLPPCYGIVGAWREIILVLRAQRANPAFIPAIALPPARPAPAGAA